MVVRLSLIATILGLCPVLVAQEIIAQEGFGGALYSIDPKTGIANVVGSPGLIGHFWTGLAMNSQGELYGAFGDSSFGYEIYELDPDTAQPTYVSYVLLSGLAAMAFDDNDTLYILNDRTAPLGTRPMDLHTVDLATGANTLIGFTGMYDIVAMDFYDNTLYARPFGVGLVTIDTTTGIATDINPAHDGITTGITSSLCFDSQGALYYLDDFLWMMDPETSTSSIINWATPFQFWAECVFLEGPNPNLSLTFSGFAGSPMKVKIAGATPFGQVAVVGANGGGGPTTIPAGFFCAGVQLDLNSNMRLLGIGTADQDGYLELGPQLMPAGAVGKLRVQAVDLSPCETTNKVIVSF